MLRCSAKLGPTKEAEDVGEGQKSTNIYTKLNISKTKNEQKKKKKTRRVPQQYEFLCLIT